MYTNGRARASPTSYNYDSPRRFRATILASGGGTNAQSVFDAVAANRLAARPRRRDREPVRGATFANEPRAPASLSQPSCGTAHAETRAAYDARVGEAVAATEPELILLLGWMHLLPPAFIERFAEIVNVHPAFLPFDPDADEVVHARRQRDPGISRRACHSRCARRARASGWARACIA